MCLGIPGRIVEIRDDLGLRMGTIDFGGVRREVCLAYLEEDTKIGDYAVVHVGFAISRVDEEEAKRTFELLREMGELEELEWTGEGNVSGQDTGPSESDVSRSESADSWSGTGGAPPGADAEGTEAR